MDPVDRLYQIYEILTAAGDNVTDHEAEYMEIIKAVKSNGDEKKLACQFIPKFLKHFPKLFDVALEAHLDLAEDEDVTVRRLAFKHLPGFCKVCKEFVPKIADILTQMLISEDSSEVAIVQSSLMNIMEIDARGTLQGILIQISKAEEDEVRKRAIDFLSAKLKVLPEDVLTKEVEESFLESCKEVLPKLSIQDFFHLLPLMTQLKIAKAIPVQNSIVDIIALHLDFDDEFQASAACVSGFLNYLNKTSIFFSPFVNSNKFVSYILVKIFPLLDEIKSLEHGEALVLDIFKSLAEISGFIWKDTEMEQYAETVFQVLLNYLPLPPDNSGEGDSSTAEPNLLFTHVECLLFTFVQFLKCNDKVLMSEDNASRFKDLKIRLQFLSRVNTRALKHIRESQKNIVVIDEESKMKAIAERTLHNLNILIKDFFRSPPSFRGTISFSWKSEVEGRTGGLKRRLEASGSDADSSKTRKACRSLYVPPSGKYSSCISSKDSTSSKESESTSGNSKVTSSTRKEIKFD